MKALGIVRNIDSLGRIVIPMEVRKTKGWNQNTPMEMFMDGDRLIIQSYEGNREKVEVLKQLQAVKNFTENEAAQEMIQNAIKFIERG